MKPSKCFCVVLAVFAIISVAAEAASPTFEMRVSIPGLRAVPGPAQQPQYTYAQWTTFNDGGISTSDGTTLMLTSNQGSYTWKSAMANIGKSSGKWYFETFGANAVGIESQLTAQGTWAGLNAYVYQGSYYAAKGTITNSNVTAETSNVGVAVDLDAGTITYYDNCVAVSPVQYFTPGGKTWYPTVSDDVQSTYTRANNFGASALHCAVPAGYNAGWYN